MDFRTKIITLSVIIALTALQTGVSAQETPTASDTKALSFPYIARITGNDVIVRSGAGTNYYACGKLFKTDKVRVVGTQFSWSRITPPPGSFSWISKQYVAVDPQNPAIGTVTGNVVRVYAGAPGLMAMRSTTTQTRLNTGDKVTLLGEEQDDYYKIAPPANAYLWVSSQYTQPVAEAGAVETAYTAELTGTADTYTASAVTPEPIISAASRLTEFKALEAQVKLQRAKPADQRSYAEIKKKLTVIADDENAGKAARYAKYTISQIERIELALRVIKEVQMQDKQLELSLKRIEKARLEKLAESPEMGKFAVVGTLRKSSLFGSSPALKHYRITDKADKIVCYALATGLAAEMDLTGFVDRKVGLLGTVEPHPETAGSLVKFDNIVALK